MSRLGLALTSQWDMDEPLVIAGLGEMVCTGQRVSEGEHLLAEKLLAGKTLKVNFRQGGEKIQPVGREGRHSLKKLFQEEGIPPWERDRLPLLLLDDELIAVADLWVADSFAAQAGDLGYELAWTPESKTGV